MKALILALMGWICPPAIDGNVCKYGEIIFKPYECETVLYFDVATQQATFELYCCNPGECADDDEEQAA